SRSPRTATTSSSAAETLLAEQPGAVVFTVFAGGPPAAAALTPWDADCGFRPGDDVMARRRAEDAAALELVGATPRWLPFRDAQYGEPAAIATIGAAVRNDRHEGLVLPVDESGRPRAVDVPEEDPHQGLPSRRSTASCRSRATSGALRTSSLRVTGVGTRIARTPAARAAATSAPMSPTYALREAGTPSIASALSRPPGSGFRQRHPASAGWQQTNHASKGPRRRSIRRFTCASCARDSRPSATAG